MTRIAVVEGDITQVDVDAVLVTTTSRGPGFQGVNGAILRVAGGQYHRQVVQQEPRDLVTVIARGSRTTHQGKFDHVIFVVDDLQSPLREVVAVGLGAADRAGLKSVALPTIRMGVMLGIVERSAEEAVEEMAAGVRQHFADQAESSLESVTFVVFLDPGLAELLRAALADL